MKKTPNRTAQVVLKLRPHELHALDRAAEEQGVWRAEFARDAIVRAVEREIASNTSDGLTGEPRPRWPEGGGIE